MAAMPYKGVQEAKQMFCAVCIDGIENVAERAENDAEQSGKHEKRPAEFGPVFFVGRGPIGCEISTVDALDGSIGSGVHLLATA